MNDTMDSTKIENKALLMYGELKDLIRQDIRYYIASFLFDAPFLYLVKNLEKLWFSDVCRGYRN